MSDMVLVGFLPIIGSIVESIKENWVMVLITVGVALLTTLASIILNRRIQTNAAEERYSRAKDDLLRVLDEHLIAGKEIYPDRMDNLISAIDREHSVDFSSKVSKIEVLEELQYRVETSTHLESERKETYSDQIESTIAEIEMLQASPPSVDLDEVISEIEEELHNDNKESVKTILDDVRSSHPPQPQVNITSDIEEAATIFTVAVSIVSFFVIVFGLDLISIILVSFSLILLIAISAQHQMSVKFDT